MINQKGYSHIAVVVIISLIAITMVGAVVYFKQEADEVPVVNTSANENISIANPEPSTSNFGVKFLTGEVLRLCTTDADCVLADRQKDYSECCSVPSCDDLEESKWVSVNNSSLIQYKSELQGTSCDLVDCPEYVAPLCEQSQYKYDQACNTGKCVKTYTRLNINE